MCCRAFSRKWTRRWRRRRRKIARTWVTDLITFLMAHLPLYLLREDILFLNDWLNATKEIAFLVSDGKGRWIAKSEHRILGDIGTQYDCDRRSMPGSAEYLLWHVPSGPLPLVSPTGTSGVKLQFKDTARASEPTILDPWKGWDELRTGANSRVPWLGPGHVGSIHLEIRDFQDQIEEIPLSGFGWIGNHYKTIGNAAPDATMKFWKRLRSMAKKVGHIVPRGNRAGFPKDSYAFPQAFREISNGRPCAVNP